MAKLTTKGKILKFALITGVVFGLGLFIYAQKDTEKPETDYQKVDRIGNFYTTSGYVTGYDYEDDIKTLQWIKQDKLDDLDYKQTFDYIKTQKTDNEFITQIDQTISQAKELKKQEPLPDYLKLDTKATQTTQTSSKAELNFINLLK